MVNGAVDATPGINKAPGKTKRGVESMAATMGGIRFTPRGPGVFAGALLFLAAGCTATPNEPAGLPQPERATYRCDDGKRLVVGNSRTSVTITAENGGSIDLPASPPGSLTRYATELHALELEGREALFFTTGQAPLSCKR